MDETRATAIGSPLSDDAIRKLRAGQRVLITGTLIVARDAAHRRFAEARERGDPLPFDPMGQLLYYMGPSPAKPGHVIGSAGPTTSQRMDLYTPELLALGLKGMIGKGPRSREVRQAMMRYSAVYFATIGGAGALLAHSIVDAVVIAYEDLAAEAVQRIEVVGFPAIVVNDIYGGDAYEDGRAKYGQG